MNNQKLNHVKFLDLAEDEEINFLTDASQDLVDAIPVGDFWELKGILHNWGYMVVDMVNNDN